MRRYTDGKLAYGPGDKVLIGDGEMHVPAKVISPPEQRKGRELYRVRFPDGTVDRVYAEAIWKQADSGGTGFVKHIHG